MTECLRWRARVARVGIGDGPGWLDDPDADAPTEPKWARRAQDLCYELLEGVGGPGPDKRDRFERAFHLRRPLAEAVARAVVAQMAAAKGRAA